VPINRVRLDYDNPVEGYEQGVNPNSDAADLRGTFYQNDSSDDEGVLVSRDASDNLTFTDPLAGTKTLSQLAAASSGVPYYEFLLDNEPIVETGANDCVYTPTYSGIFVTKEEWKRNDTTLIKSIDYTYTGINVTTEVRKVFAANGTTILAQVTWTHSYTGVLLTGSTMVRDV
jgi:hypothetical protein